LTSENRTQEEENLLENKLEYGATTEDYEHRSTERAEEGNEVTGSQTLPAQN
jgi:hypothetical protein